MIYSSAYVDRGHRYRSRLQGKRSKAAGSDDDMGLGDNIPRQRKPVLPFLAESETLLV